MRLKYYATLSGYDQPDIRAKILAFYEQYMFAKVTKSSTSHSNIKLYGQIDLLICQGRAALHSGYHIIKFEQGDQISFRQAVDRIGVAIKLGIASLHFDEAPARWGTTFFEFADPFGLTWVLEVNTSQETG